MSGAGLKMADLVERTGATREAIRFYINEGLLPKPEKTARNQARYSERHVELIRLIRDLQQEQFLPLKAIRALLHEDGEFEFTPAQRAALDRAQRKVVFEHRYAEETLAGLCERLGFNPDEVEEFLASGVLMATRADTPLEAEDAEIIHLWHQMREHGVTRERGFRPRDAEAIKAAVNVVFEQELRMFVERTGDMNEDQVAALINTSVPATDRIFAILHHRRIEQFLATLRSGANPEEDPS